MFFQPISTFTQKSKGVGCLKFFILWIDMDANSWRCIDDDSMLFQHDVDSSLFRCWVLDEWLSVQCQNRLPKAWL